MKAIQYTKKLSNSIVHLMYCTCTNDTFVNSKQASILEDFILAFIIEFNRLFIANSLLIQVLKKHLFVKMDLSMANQKQIFIALFTEYKNGFLEVFNTNNFKFNKLNKLTMFE